MERTTIMLPTDLKMDVMKKSKEMGLSFGALIREALKHFLSHTPPSQDPFYSDTATFQGDVTDLAEHHDRYLYD